MQVRTGTNYGTAFLLQISECLKNKYLEKSPVSELSVATHVYGVIFILMLR